MARALSQSGREEPSTIRQSAAPPEPREETVSVTPAHTPRRRGSNRRRQPLAPPPFPELTTEPVPALRAQDVQAEAAALGDDDAHENTQTGLRSPERRSRAWVAVVAVLLLLGAGAVTVILGLDGGRVSSWMKPLLGMGPKDGTPTATATAPANPPAPQPGTPAPKPTPAPSTDTAAAV
ncbi:hypothetical protein ACLESD_52880, partial [Pyxidicoccus sp. 3LFB2]